jgi:hypothetical protein
MYEDLLVKIQKVLEFYADEKQYQNGEYGYQLIAPIELDELPTR